MILALPISLIMLVFVAILLTKILFKVDKDVKLDKVFIEDEYKQLGKFSSEEKAISIIFLTTALLWIFRSDILLGFITIPGWSNLLPTAGFINDGTVAITMAFILFLIPSKSGKRALLDQTAFSKVPWGIILLFGGGFALAKGFSSTGLSDFTRRSTFGTLICFTYPGNNYYCYIGNILNRTYFQYSFNTNNYTDRCFRVCCYRIESFASYVNCNNICLDGIYASSCYTSQHNNLCRRKN
ncbi:MAG: anion permease [Ignavibacteriales bacterium]|nr:anion permease [Ignavibacteriales bacterium]